MASSMIHVRMDDDLKEQATKALDAIGLSTSDAVRLLFRRIVVEQGFPLELKVPNAETLAAMREVEAMVAARRPRFHSADAMFESLDSAGE